MEEFYEDLFKRYVCSKAIFNLMVTFRLKRQTCIVHIRFYS